jgi:hypothetical protein
VRLEAGDTEKDLRLLDELFEAGILVEVAAERTVHVSERNPHRIQPVDQASLQIFRLNLVEARIERISTAAALVTTITTLRMRSSIGACFCGSHRRARKGTPADVHLQDVVDLGGVAERDSRRGGCRRQSGSPIGQATVTCWVDLVMTLLLRTAIEDAAAATVLAHGRIESCSMTLPNRYVRRVKLYSRAVNLRPTHP